MYIHANPNPNGSYVEDCVIRAIAIATGRTWDKVFFELCLQAYIAKNMPSVNKVWGSYLASIGFSRFLLPNTCPDCYTIRDFCRDNQIGAILSLNNVNVPKDFNGTPQQLAQYLMNSGQMPQEQFQQFAQTANQIQSMGLFPKL